MEKIFETHLVQKSKKWGKIDKYLVRQQTKAERYYFKANKEERILVQVVKGMKTAEEKRNLISKLNLTLKLAIESIRKEM